MTPLTQAQAGLRSGSLTCGSTPVLLPLDALILVGFGEAKVTRDEVIVWQATSRTNEDDCWTTRDAERAALADPDRDWRIVFFGPLSGETYQRHDAGRWVLVEKNRGFCDEE